MTKTSRMTIEHPMPDVACVKLAGAWRNEERLPDPGEVWREIQVGLPVHRLTFDTRHVTEWDSGLVTFVIRLLEEAKARGIESDRTELPDGAQRRLRLAEAVPERQTGRDRARPPWLARIGAWTTA
jgi:phospholipid/cholesterol/gamma-HCH transport system permease protein